MLLLMGSLVQFVYDVAVILEFRAISVQKLVAAAPEALAEFVSSIW